MRTNLIVSLIFILIIDVSQQQFSSVLSHNHNPSVDHSVPFPECTKTKLASSFLRKDVVEFVYRSKIDQENEQLNQERERNLNLKNRKNTKKTSTFR